MPLKTKTKSKPTLRSIKIRIRRIANRNPRNIRGFQTKESKLKRAFAGFLIILAILLLALAGSSTPKSKQLQADTLGIANSIESSCAAQTTAQNLVNLRTQKSKLVTRYVDYAENASWEKIAEIDTQLQGLNLEIATYEKKFTENRNSAAISITRLENEVLICADAESCATAEQNLTTAQNCDKQAEKAAIYLEEQTKILKKYKFRDGENNLVGKTEIQKLFTVLNQYRAKTDNQHALLQKCLADSLYQENTCTKSRSDYTKAWEAEATQLEKIAQLATSLEAVTKKLDTDITALRFAQTDATDFTAAQGLGWCQQSLREANTTLAAKTADSMDLKVVYEGALNQLNAVKTELSAHIVEAEKQLTATTAELDTIFKALTFWKIFSGIF